MMAQYHVQKLIISKLILLCKAAATCFNINGLFLAIQPELPATEQLRTGTPFGSLNKLGVGGVGLHIHRSFQKCSFCWEVRI